MGSTKIKSLIRIRMLWMKNRSKCCYNFFWYNLITFLQYDYFAIKQVLEKLSKYKKEVCE